MNQEISKKSEKNEKITEKRGDWLVLDMYETTKRKIRGYAGSEGITNAEALKIIIDEWEALKKA